MLLQIFILKACPDLQEMRGDKKADTLRHTLTPSWGDGRYLAASNRTEQQANPLTTRTSCLPDSPKVSCRLSKDLNSLRHQKHLTG